LKNRSLFPSRGATAQPFLKKVYPAFSSIWTSRPNPVGRRLTESQRLSVCPQ
jgi:hypothetical protein